MQAVEQAGPRFLHADTLSMASSLSTNVAKLNRQRPSAYAELSIPPFSR